MSGFNYILTARTLIRHLSRRRRRQLAGLALLTVMATFAELLSLSAAFPFLAVLAAPERLFEMPLAQPLIDFLNVDTPRDLIAPLSILFAVAITVSAALRLTLISSQIRLSHLIGIDLAVEILERSLHQPYRVHAARNSSRVISVVNGKSGKLVSGFVLPTLTILSAATLLGVVGMALLTLLPNIALPLLMGIAFMYGLTAFVLRGPIHRNGEIISRELQRVLQALQESLGGIRDVLLDGSQDMHVKRYHYFVRLQRMATANNAILGAMPRFVVEALGMVLIVAIAYRLTTTPGGLQSALPILGGVALAAQRMLPVAQQTYNAWSQMRSAQPAIQECLTYLAQPSGPARGSARPSALPFERDIHLDSVSMRYDSAEHPALDRIDLKIPRGTRVGIIGPTGSGKSTLADILMGLISPAEGEMRVDDVVVNAGNQSAWQRHIAHVPQAIFLTDATLAENIAFGLERDQIDMTRLRNAIAQAQLTQTVENLPQGLETRVGERGVRLSGGQRQRIAIARALYRQADVIVFDEATSALDTATETRVMEAINTLDRNLTLVMIAHRLSTLRNCDMIVEIEAGRIARTGPPEDMLGEAQK